MVNYKVPVFMSLALTLTACPGVPSDQAAIAERASKCEKNGQRCRTPQGPLGVCLQTPSQRWHCTPQH